MKNFSEVGIEKVVKGACVNCHNHLLSRLSPLYAINFQPQMPEYDLI